MARGLFRHPPQPTQRPPRLIQVAAVTTPPRSFVVIIACIGAAMIGML